MCKLITYWKSNFRTELNYYGINQRKNIHFSDEEINIYIVEAFKEIDEDNDDDNFTPAYRFTGSKKISKDNCYVLIEPIWIEKFVDLSHDSIIKDINVPKDILDDFDEDVGDEGVDNDNGVGDGDESDNDSRKGVYNYNIDDLFSNDDEEEEEEE